MLACAQNLYLALVEALASRKIVVGRVTGMLEDVAGQIGAAGFEAGQLGGGGSSVVLRWNAVYTAVGLSLGLLMIHCSLI